MIRRQRCPLIPVRVERLESTRFRLTIHEPLAVDYALSPDAFNQAVMQDCMATLERWILERPEQWFWVQRLWQAAV
jgi:KDO2-lipid IV(A) lauroyltransferase